MCCALQRHTTKVWDPSGIVGGVSDAIITCAAVCMFCFGSLLLRTCSYCLSLYANLVNWYSVLSFTTAFNFTLHFKWSLNPVEMNKYISHAWFCGLFLYCEPSCTIQYKTSEFWSFYLFIFFANIKLKLFYYRGRLFKMHSMQVEEKVNKYNYT